MSKSAILEPIMIELVAVLAAVSPHIKDYAASRADKIADGLLARAFRWIVPDEKLLKANEIFVMRFGKELDSTMDLSTLTAREYQAALETLLANATAQDVLMAPLDGRSELDWRLLRGLWDEMSLIPLPSEFDWPKVSRTYGQAIRNQMLVDADLRPVISAIANIRSAEASEKTAVSLGHLVGPRRALDFRRYAMAVKTAYAHLKLGAIDTDWSDYERGIRLDRIYVPQTAKQALPPLDLTRDYLRSAGNSDRPAGNDFGTEELDRRREQYANLSARPITEFLESPSSQRLVILGDPGLGKSTLLRLLALKWTDDPGRPFTMCIELRRVALDSGGDVFLNYVEKGADSTCCLPRTELHEYLSHHSSLVLFDGLDEVGDAHRDDAVSQIIRFADDYPMARIVVTTRIQGYSSGSTHPDQFRDARFVHVTLQDFSESEIEQFIEAWHQEVFPDAAERGRFALRLQTAIDESFAISELAANPLLLTLMAVLSRNQDLPRDRAKLYERCAELLLKNWDLEKFPDLRERRGAQDIKDKLGPDQKMRILERVAATMHNEQTGLANCPREAQDHYGARAGETRGPATMVRRR
jgi:GTPase SAR1 family protein